MEDMHGTFLICVDTMSVGSISFFKAMYFDGLEITCILFDQASWGKGYMTEALTLLVTYLFTTKKDQPVATHGFPRQCRLEKGAATMWLFSRRSLARRHLS